MSQLGTDFDCADDITEDWALADSPQRVFLQACYRRLYLTNLFYSTGGYGLGIEGYLLDIATQAEITGAIQTELLRDERVKLVNVNWIGTAATILVTDHDNETFSLTLTIDAVASALRLEEP